MSAVFPGRVERAGRRGSTLVEVMIGIVLLALVILTLAPAYLASETTVKRGQNIELATQAARQQLEAWRRGGYASLPEIPGGESSVTRSFTPPGTLPSGTGRTVFTLVDSSLAATATDSGRRRVAVTVSWTGTGADHGSVTLTTLMIE